MKRQPSRWLSVLLLFAVAVGGCATARKTHAALSKSKSSSTKSRIERDIADQSSSTSEPPQSVGATRKRSDSQITTDADRAESGPSHIQPVAATSSEVVPSPDPTTSTTEVAVLEESRGGYTLSLGGILHLANAQNPNVALARERINEAYSRVERAEALWLPSLRAGLNYNHHEGAIQDVAGNVFQTNRSAFGGGLGANMYGAASPGVPGVIAQFHLSDAIFQPKIAAHQAASRQFAATAARNDVLRDASINYLELVRAEHGTAIAREALANTEKLDMLTREYAETGQGLQADHQRMETEVAIRQEQLTVQEEAIEVASARLAQVLHADPSVPISSAEPAVTPLDVMVVEESPASCVVLGLSRRPELCEQKHLVCEAVEKLNREKYAPLIPSVLLGMSYGGMGGGLGNSIINTSQRWDADAVAYWELRNLGVGDHAARGEAASVARQAQMREVALLDRVAREVIEAHTQVMKRKKRLVQAEKGIAAAVRSYELNQERIQNAQGLPIEVLQSIQALANARRAYLNAVIDYNIAQFELSRATGWFADET